MTKEEILNGMSEDEFYSLYPTKQAWDNAQKMANGGSPFIQGIPFGAGITMQDGGPYGTQVYKDKKMTPQEWEKYNLEKGYKQVPSVSRSGVPARHAEFYNPKEYAMTEGSQNIFTRVGDEGKTVDYNADPTYKPIQSYGYKAPIEKKPVSPWSPAGQLASGEGLFYKDQNPKLGAYTYMNGQYVPYAPQEPMAATTPPIIEKYGGGLPGGPFEYDMPCMNCGGGYMQKGGDVHDKPGGSNVGKKTFADGSPRTGPYVGPSGGAPQGSYPIPDINHARSALSLAHHAPNPSGIKAAVYAKYPQLKKQMGGIMSQDLEGSYPQFNQGGYGDKMQGGGPFNYGQFPAMKTGGDTTEQGANQDFINQRNSDYRKYIQNNVLTNLQQEEAQKVGNAFMQMEYGMHQMPDGSMMPNSMMQMGGGYDAMNPQNAALQNMYSQSMNDYLAQRGQDQDMFRQANLNLFNIPQAQNGYQQPTHSNILHQLAAEFGPSSRRTGLPLFPGNMSPYYGINKKDAKALINAPQPFRAQGIDITEKYGLLGRNKFLRENLGIGPKSIHYKFTGKRGYAPGEPQPAQTDTQYTPPIGTTQPTGQSARPYDPEMDYSGAHPAWNFSVPTPAFPMNQTGPRASQVLNESDPMQGYIPKDIYRQSQLQKNSKGGLLKRYQSLGEVNPIGMSNNWGFLGAQGNPSPAPIGSYPQITMADESRNSPTGARPQVQYDPTKDRSNEDVTVEGDLRRKWQGVGETIGQYAIPGINKAASLFETKDYLKNKKKLDQSMLADNTFLTSPLNAKSRGDYDVNSGNFRPDQHTAVQFPGYAQWGGFNTMQNGGVNEGQELDLSPEEIAELKALGYQIEELD